MSSPTRTSLPSIRELLPEQFDPPTFGRYPPPPPPPLAIPSAPRTLTSPTLRYTSPTSHYPSPISPLGAPTQRSNARRNTIASTSAPYPAPYPPHSPTLPVARRALSPPAASTGHAWPSPPSNTVRLDPRIVLDPSGTLPSPPPSSTASGFTTFRLSPAPTHASIALAPPSHTREAQPRGDIEMRFYDPHGPPDDPGSSSDTSSAERHGPHGVHLTDWETPHSTAATGGARAPRRRRHEEERRHECTQCHKRFSRPSSLRIHENTHTGHKPFECPQPGCGRVFSVNSNMRRHYRTHAGTSTMGPLSPGAVGTGNAYPRIGDEDEEMSGSSEDEH